MSLRVHKMVGWGLRGLRVEKGQIVDPRILPKENENREDDTVTAFLGFITANQDVIVKHLLPDAKKKVGPKRAFEVAVEELKGEVLLFKSFVGKDVRRLKNPSSHIKFDEGHGPRRGTLLFQPVTQDEWFRWDDALDWIEETHFHWQRHRTRVLKTGPYPYNHWMVRFRDPSDALINEWRKNPVENLPGHWHADRKGYVGLSTGRWNEIVGSWGRGIPPAASTPAWLAHFKNDFRPAIPAAVVALVLWSGMAKKPAELLDALRPMIHVWWE